MSGQRQARVAAVKNQHTPEDLVWAWSFFRQHYLLSLPDGVWHKPPVYESPPCHYEFIYDLGAYARNVKILPRSFAKTTLIEELLLTLCYGRAPFKTLLIRAPDDFVKTSFARLMGQIEGNERLLDDFGELKPKRSSAGIWSKGNLLLNNGFELRGRSVMGKLLGLRPQLVICDDAEFDTTMKISPTSLAEHFRQMWYNSVIPMLDEGCAAALVGTLFNRKLFIYRQATTPEEEDPTLAYWNREVLAIKDPETGEPTWPAKFPEEKIEELRLSLPPAVFAAQYMNDPGTEDAQVLVLDDPYSYYAVTSDQDVVDYEQRPFDSVAKLISWAPHKETGKPTRVERPFAETLKRMYRVLVADPIRKPSSTSDFACVMVVGIERHGDFQDVWWPLAIRLGRPRPTVFLNWIWELGRIWLPRVVGIESIGLQKEVDDKKVQETILARSSGGDWLPRVYPIQYRRDFVGDLGKPSRISSLASRFETFRCKLPKHRLHQPAWRALHEQVRDFTMDMAMLPFDDAVDTLAMPNFILGLRKGFSGPVSTAPLTLQERLATGEKYLPGTRIEIMSALNADELTPEAMAGLDKIRRRDQNQTESKRRRSRKPRRGRGVFHYGNPA
jgi:hypothetical protein